MQKLDFPGKVIFRRKNICEISTEKYVLCSFELKKDPVFRIGAIRMDLRKKYGFCPISIYSIVLSYFWIILGRKTCMGSSHFPSTITIKKSKSLSVKDVEFWKRYHQNGRIRRNPGNLCWHKKILMKEEIFWMHNF